MSLSPKVLAYIRASEVIAATRVERGIYPKAEAAAINRELQAISKRLYQSARAAVRREAMTEFFTEHPDKLPVYKHAQALGRYRSALRSLCKRSTELEDGKK